MSLGLPNGFARFVAIRSKVAALSPDYFAWLDGEGEDVEPELAPEVRRRIDALVEEGDGIAWR